MLLSVIKETNCEFGDLRKLNFPKWFFFSMTVIFQSWSIPVYCAFRKKRIFLQSVTSDGWKLVPSYHIVSLLVHTFFNGENLKKWRKFTIIFAQHVSPALPKCDAELQLITGERQRRSEYKWDRIEVGKKVIMKTKRRLTLNEKQTRSKVKETLKHIKKNIVKQY